MMQLSNMSKMVHDKVSYNDPYRPMSFYCEGPLNSLAANKDFTQVVVAGRSVFKILNIKEDCFTENINLRVGRHINLTYSAADVAWHPSDENMLASAATNGCVVIWNLCKSAKSKQATIYQEHKRSVNRVAFHGSEHHQLLSASQDGVVMIHDVRKPTVCTKFGVAGTDSVRDAQFCPPSMGYFFFAAAYDNGTIQIWDMRRPDRCEKQFMAHNGPVFSLDWHPGDKTYWLATAGRDKMIKVWDMVRPDRAASPNLIHSITNIASVARIKWRPNRKHHISSCSLLVDHSINVWDVGRPYIPFASFDGHMDVATCIEWREDCHVFLSCGRDGNVIQHVFSEAKRPADHVNIAGVDISINGEIGYAYFDKKDKSTSGSSRSKKISKSRQFTQASSSLNVFQNNFSQEDECQDMLMQYFKEIALEYKLQGMSLVDLCKHNGVVASNHSKHHIAQMWNNLAVIYAPSSQPNVPNHMSRTGPQQDKQDHSDLAVKPTLKRAREIKVVKPFSHVDTFSGSNEESSDVEGENSEVEKSVPEPSTESNFLFGDGGEDETSSDLYNTGGIVNPEHYDWINKAPPSEAFQPRHELNPMTGTHPLTMGESDLALSTTMEPAPQESHDQSWEPTLVVKFSYDFEIPDYSSTVADLIKFLAEQGDVQTAVSMLTVLGDQIRTKIDEAYQESWFLAYIDLLGRYELWTVANDVIKQCKLMSVNSLNQESTVIHAMCFKCSRACERATWLCDKCKRILNLCSVCHQPVRGAFVWCQGCCHGGHVDHMMEWLSVSNQCPAGCSHHCEYT
ncbi:GATOR complex protein WDR24-like [Physella acuta]|uniref:GATOR complex protein WDR24-like n=1 Tax=Physella acuta TaxID=109671 RepID=UPI0027DB71F9|nr:GATOR complex protein WDR24-like [Physella acuta]XP_059148992.1 GATOR complex protein WDR24-like [Physella acuta]XP_059148993.1 GATOR complex protein WDR24-like [Physella acuta]XP_059148994.1 GATOR complex protein WDR24-like [Physella acuta]XP_059148995.1 GATOR complex protein WDR24-like [Physella acuta]XP_059148996.1 GATOR complex protein WDR24-like [Physella acuta]